MKVLLLGMGNPILSDDGVGLFIARELEKSLLGVDVSTTAMAGLEVLELIRGYDRIFVIDASTMKKCEPGKIVKFNHEENSCVHLFSSHGLNFFELLCLGKKLGYVMPSVEGVYGIEIGDEVCFGCGLTRHLKEKFELIARSIAEDIRACLSRWKNEAEVQG
jgi:hydrogenase maturation protease